MKTFYFFAPHGKPQNNQMHGLISPRRACDPCGYTMKISSRYHRLLIYDVKSTTKTDGMGNFNAVMKGYSSTKVCLGLLHNAKTTCLIFGYFDW